MQKQKLTVLVKEPNKPPYTKEINNSLEDFQGIVGGFIEAVEMPGIKNVLAFVNEEGKLNALPGNFWLPEYDDCICGTCYMVGISPRSGETVSINDKQINECKKYIQNYELPSGLDLYAHFPLLQAYMKNKYKTICKKQSAMS